MGLGKVSEPQRFHETHRRVRSLGGTPAAVRSDPGNASITMHGIRR
jgi:hypothetical protein